jgi:hypothetical protein
MCYEIDTEFTSVQVLKSKPFFSDEMKDIRLDMAFDLRNTKRVDGAAVTFFKNLHEQLQKGKRKIAFFGGPQEIQEQLASVSSFLVYSSIVEFERDFHEINPELNRTFFRLSEGRGNFRTLKMICPLCFFEDVSGFMVDEEYYRLTWSDNEIVPVYEPLEPDQNSIDFSCYQVAVCPKCFYASTRLDWFTVIFPEGCYESHLTPENKAKLSNSAAQRRALAVSYDGVDDNSFFRMPREKSASYVSWLLNEFNLKHMNDQQPADGFDIVVSNFMMCKFAAKEVEIDSHMHAAHAWLYGIMDNREYYSTLRLAKTYVYLISVLVAQDKIGDARKLYRELEKDYGGMEDCKYLINRAQHLLLN